MKTEHGIRGKFGYALGFALAAGIALTTALTAHAQPADATLPCPLGAACPPLCTPSTIATCPIAHRLGSTLILGVLHGPSR